MNNQEKLVHEYLSGYFGVDLNESIDLLTESDIRDAVQDLNTLVFALNEQTASFGTVISAAQKAGEYRDLLAKRIASKGGKLDPKTAGMAFAREFKFEAELPGRTRAETDRLGAENKADYDKKFTDVTPFERAKNAMKIMDKPDGSFGSHGEKNRKNLKPKFKKEVKQRSRLERAGMDPNREDYDSLDTQLSAHAGIVAQERRADKKRRGVTPSTGDYRLPSGRTDYAAMARDMRESKTLREQSGGASMYPVIPRRNSTRTPEEQAAYEVRQKTANNVLALQTNLRNTNPDGSQMTPEQKATRSQRIRDERRERMETPENLSRRQAKLDHRDRVRAELTNRSRARREMGPLGQEQMIGTEANRAASGQVTNRQRYAAAAEARKSRFGGKEPLEAPSEEDYMKSLFPVQGELSTGRPVNPRDVYGQGPRRSRKEDAPTGSGIPGSKFGSY